jgi:EmrB/QacA subfamily drug resistance transporter
LDFMTQVELPTANRRFVLACILVAMFMSAVEATIVATAMPRIIADVGSFSLYAWVFSVFLMATATTTVIYGRLADTFGRRPTLIAGISIFLVGSFLCGVAWSMPLLILFRTIQGIGPGAIQPVANTIIGDCYESEERAAVQGYIGAVWGISAIVGPLIGSLIVEHVSWAWMFWLNIPIGALTIVGLNLFLREDSVPKRHSIDYFGAVLFVVGIIALLIVLTPGHEGIFASPISRVVFGLVAATSATLFFLHERHAHEPMISFDLWKDPLVATANGATAVAGMLIIGLTSLVPIYVQGVLLHSPLVAGMTLTTMSIGWVLSTTVASRLYRVLSPRSSLRLGALIIFCGGLIFPLLGSRSGVTLAGAGGLILGVGIGLLVTAALILVQSSVDWAMRGSATASNVFARTLGSTVGASFLGAIMNLGIARASVDTEHVVTFESIRQLLEHPGAVDDSHTLGLTLFAGLHLAFWAIAFLGLAVFLIGLLVPARAFGEQRRV